MVGSFIMYIAAIEKSDNLIVPAIPALMLFIFGAYLVFIGRKRIQKARHISWTIEALEKYDRIKRKLREK
jgi:hypothetical protein